MAARGAGCGGPLREPAASAAGAAAGTVASMLETRGDLWSVAADAEGWVVVPTNGALDSRGLLVMGAGVAGEAARRHPDLARALGDHVRAHGNTPVGVVGARVLTWPTKPAEHTVDGRTHVGWMCAARVRHPECVRGVARLVWRNAPLVVACADELTLSGPIFMPHVGCGLGGLDWTKVGPALAGVLDDRFVAVDAR